MTLVPYDNLPTAVQYAQARSRDSIFTGPPSPLFTIEYCYMCLSPRTGKPMGTSLGFEYPEDASSFPAKGDVIELHGVSFCVSEVETTAEPVWNDTTGEPYVNRFCSVTVSLLNEA